jgi:hypothetical protein
VDGTHVDAICDHLQAMIEDRIKDLIINIPPGFAKSMLCTVFFPAWVWIKRPEYRFLFASYKSEYATRDSVKCRALIQSNWYQDRWKDRFQLKAIRTKDEVRERHTGYRETTSVGTGTGARAMLVVSTIRPRWTRRPPMPSASGPQLVDRDVTTRLNDLKTGHLLVIQQRLHEEDTTAVCLEQGGYHTYTANDSKSTAVV